MLNKCFIQNDNCFQILIEQYQPYILCFLDAQNLCRPNDMYFEGGITPTGD